MTKKFAVMNVPKSAARHHAILARNARRRSAVVSHLHRPVHPPAVRNVRRRSAVVKNPLQPGNQKPHLPAHLTHVNAGVVVTRTSVRNRVLVLHPAVPRTANV